MPTLNSRKNNYRKLKRIPKDNLNDYVPVKYVANKVNRPVTTVASWANDMRTEVEGGKFQGRNYIKISSIPAAMRLSLIRTRRPR